MDYLFVSVSFILAIYVLETYVDLRQHRRLKQENPPKEVLEFIPNVEEYRKARLYNLDKSSFGFVTGLFNTLLTLGFLQFGVLPLLWDKAGDLLDWAEYPRGEIVQSCTFLIVFNVLSTVIDTPFSLYKTFVIEERHGFNRQTLRLFIADVFKGLGLFTVLGLPLAALLIKIIRWAGPEGFLQYTFGFMFFSMIFLLILFPLVIQPMFNKFTPLEEGELRERIYALCERVSFPVKKLFVMDGR